MKTIIIKFIMQHAIKIGAGLLITSIVFGGYYYWQHKQESEGRRKENAEWMEREQKINARAAAIIALKQAEYDRDIKKYKEDYTNAIKQYAQYSQKLEHDLADSVNKRLLVRTKTNNQDCSASRTSKAEVSERSSERGSDANWAELAETDSIAIQTTAVDAQKMALICSQALNFIERNGMTE